MPNPLVSVVIPAHNAEAVIERALRSVAAQDYSPIEIIVVDDASRDRTASVAQAWADRGIRLLTQNPNRGPATARNLGIRAAGGDYVAFLDADDEWHREKTTLQVRAMEARKDSSFCGCDDTWILPNGAREVMRESRKLATAHRAAWKLLLASPFVHTSSVLVRREVALRLGGFDEKLLVGEDQDLWIRLALAGAVAWIEQPLVVVYKLTEGHMQTNAEREAEFLIPMIEAHVGALKSDLSAAEIRVILGQRYAQIGRNLYASGRLGRGARLIGKAIAFGYAPASHLLFLVHASPLGRLLKRCVRGLVGAGESRQA